jgi:hypothetical protein
VARQRREGKRFGETGECRLVVVHVNDERTTCVRLRQRPERQGRETRLGDIENVCSEVTRELLEASPMCGEQLAGIGAYIHGRPTHRTPKPVSERWEARANQLHVAAASENLGEGQPAARRVVTQAPRDDRNSWALRGSPSPARAATRRRRDWFRTRHGTRLHSCVIQQPFESPHAVSQRVDPRQVRSGASKRTASPSEQPALDSVQG